MDSDGLHPTSSRIRFSGKYLTSVPGILKVVQLIAILIAFVLAATAWSSSYWCPNTVHLSTSDASTVAPSRLVLALCSDAHHISSAGWTKFTTIVGFLLTLILLNLYLFGFIEKFHRINWVLAEMVYCIIGTILLLISGAVMIPAPILGDASRSACVFFCWAAMVAYGIDAFLKFRAWRSGNVALTSRGLPDRL